MWAVRGEGPAGRGAAWEPRRGRSGRWYHRPMSTGASNTSVPARTEPAPGNPAAGASGHEMPKQYAPAEHEPRIRARWEGSGAWRADPERVLSGRARGFSIVIPPPNVTGALHLGHALNGTLQDVLCRAHRMMGDEVLWLPGTDHAGIATQAVVERRLWQEHKRRRAEMGREEFVALVQEWKDQYEATISEQLRALGCSCDWSRQRFTMDPVCARAVRAAFFRLFADGLIERGKRLVNWDPVLQTAVADDECYTEDADSFFYYLRYPLVHPHGATTQAERSAGELPPADAVPVTWGELARRGYPGAEGRPGDQPAWVTVATTRPETYMGDAAVALNPRDPRAGALRGLFVELPLVGRVVPIVEDGYVVLPAQLARTDEEAADPKAAFATGFLKVTPAHDANDYDLYQRHKQAIDRALGRPDAGLINVFSPAAAVSDRHGWSDVGDAHLFVGLTREQARARVVSEFAARSLSAGAAGEPLLEGTRPYRHGVLRSDRTKAVIEPYLSDQWFLRVTDARLRGAANEALAPDQLGDEAPLGVGGAPAGGPLGARAEGGLRFTPRRYARVYKQWHDGIRDWCISRQLWWGHRVPVWSVACQSVERLREAQARAASEIARMGFGDAAAVVADDRADPPVLHVCLLRDEPALIDALRALGLERDPDVLDTWFSSALWPLSTMGWPEPEASPDTRGLLAAFNPTAVLSTAREIITLWVSRMVMMNRYLLPEGWPCSLAEPPGRGAGPAPFRDVFIHAVVQDGEGKRMSKSAGNGVDPLDIVASHGADALRFTLCQMTTHTQDVRLPVVRDAARGVNTSPRFDLGRNVANKLWNASRFALSMLAGAPARAPAQEGLATVDRWMLSRLARAERAAVVAIGQYRFSDYAEGLYDLLWREFCDVYLEAVKPTIAQRPAQARVLADALDVVLRLAHPLMPFVTEAIWERLAAARPAAVTPGVGLGAGRVGGLLATAPWPVLDEALIDPAAEGAVGDLLGLVAAVNQARAAHGVPPKRRVVLHASARARQAMDRSPGLVETLSGVGRVEDEGAAAVGASTMIMWDGAELRLSDLAEAIDPAAERERLGKLLAAEVEKAASLRSRLEKPGYAQRAPARLVEESRAELARSEQEADRLRQLLGRLA
ncbi:MAG: valine--tRNA ligase [Isosphaera sp.]|nr:valine--tRNA ligase [Isosphaera sp.]